MYELGNTPLLDPSYLVPYSSVVLSKMMVRIFGRH